MRRGSGIDLVIQATGGIMSITGPETQEPCKVGVGVADLMCGLYCNVGILAALRHRERTGEGQHLDMALLDSQVAWLVNEGMNYLHTGESPKAWGSAHVSIVPYQAFPASDGSFILAVGTDRQFVAFAKFAGAPELSDDPRFTTNALRVRNRAACVEAVSALTRRQPRSHWLDRLPPPRRAGRAGQQHRRDLRRSAGPVAQHGRRDSPQRDRQARTLYRQPAENVEDAAGIHSPGADRRRTYRRSAWRIARSGRSGHRRAKAQRRGLT